MPLEMGSCFLEQKELDRPTDPNGTQSFYLEWRSCGKMSYSVYNTKRACECNNTAFASSSVNLAVQESPFCTSVFSFSSVFTTSPSQRFIPPKHQTPSTILLNDKTSTTLLYINTFQLLSINMHPLLVH